MPRFKGATYFNLKGGINTEASPLNIPPTDAIDAVNIDINIDGSILRRRAFDFLGESDSGNLYITSNISNYKLDGTIYRAEVPSFAEFNPTTTDGTLARHFVTHIGNQFKVYDYSSPNLLKNLDDPKYTLPSVHSTKQAMFHTSMLQDGQRVYVINRYHPIGFIQYTNTTDSFSWQRGDVQQRVDNGVDAAPITDVIDGDTGFTTGVFANSRLWVANCEDYPNTVFYSQIVVNGDEYYKMYQEADPYDATDNAIVATDGGSIQLTGAERILALAQLGNGILVFANNGVWYIGGSNGFNPLNYSINKISDSGIAGTTCWCAVEQQLVYFGENDIYTILQGTAIETPEVQAIGNKIVTLYNDIPIYNKEAGVAVYEPNTKKIYFFTNFEAYDWQRTMRFADNHSVLRDALVFDVRLAAWAKYSLSDDEDGDKVAIGYAGVFSGGRITDDIVTNNAGATVTNSTLETVTIQSRTVSQASKVLLVLLQKKNGTTWDIGIGELTSDGLIDFETSTADSESNKGYMTGSYQIFNDVAHRKFTGYLIPLFKRIESGVLDGSGIDITPGGCKYRVDYNWAVNSNSPSYGTLKDAYKPYKYITSRFDGADPGDEIVSSRLKLRGSGSSFKIYFESDGDKDFQLYGWQVMLNTKPRM